MANSPHDALFRYTFGQPEHAAALLQTILSPGLVAELDWSTLTLLPGTRVDRALGRHQTDLLYAVRAARSLVYIHVVVEHSSRVDRWMAFRMLDSGRAPWPRADPARQADPCRDAVSPGRHAAGRREDDRPLGRYDPPGAGRPFR